MGSLPQDRFVTGATVLAPDGTPVGTVEEVAEPSDDGEFGYLIVRDATINDLIQVPLDKVLPPTEGGSSVQLVDNHSTLLGARESQGTATVRAGASLTDDGRLIVPLHEEVLIPSTHETELGSVVIRKRVETVPTKTMVDVSQDFVAVERVTLDQEVETMPEVRREDDTLIVPVVEEVLVTEKRLMLREEVRITLKRATDQVPVEGTIRREVVEVEEARRDTTPQR